MHGASIIFTKHWYDPLATGAQLKYACDVEFWESALQSRSMESDAYFSEGLPCTHVNVTAALVNSMNQKLAPQNWTVSFESSKNVSSVEGTSFLMLSSLDSQSPLNVTLATELAASAMKEWKANNPQCDLKFNGQSVAASTENLLVF